MNCVAAQSRVSGKVKGEVGKKAERQSWQQRWEHVRLNVAQFRLLWDGISTLLFTIAFLSLLQLLFIPWSVLCKALLQLQQFSVP